MIRFSRVQSGMALAFAAVVFVSSCDKATASPVDLGTETVSDASGKILVEISFLDRPGSESELSFTLKAIGTEEMDKIALDVAVDNMFLVEGGAQWSGFVPPRQPQSHRVVVKPVDDAMEPRVRISVSRFRDSELLMHREVRFTPQGELIPE